MEHLKIDVNGKEFAHAIKKFDFNKACRSDGIDPICVQNICSMCTFTKAMCFTSFISHRVLPESLMSVELVPVLVNYLRFQTTVEVIVLNRIEMNMNTTPSRSVSRGNLVCFKGNHRHLQNS